MPYKKPLTPEQKAQARERNKRYRLRKKEENEKMCNEVVVVKIQLVKKARGGGEFGC